MILDIVFGLIIVIFFLIGKKRGFVVEFFGTFKYLIILYTMKFLYPTVEKVFKLTDNNIDHLKKYFISFLILYVILSEVFLLRFIYDFFISGSIILDFVRCQILFSSDSFFLRNLHT